MTSAYSSRPDGEYFADESSKPIPLRETWEQLSVNQLLDIQALLFEKLWTLRSNPVIAAHINSSLSAIQNLISERSSST